MWGCRKEGRYKKGEEMEREEGEERGKGKIDIGSRQDELKRTKKNVMSGLWMWPKGQFVYLAYLNPWVLSKTSHASPPPTSLAVVPTQ